MGMKMEQLGWNEDGTPHWHYKPDSGHAVITGPHISGTVVDSSGRLIDVTPHAVEAESPEHAAEIAHLIAMRHVRDNHPLHRGSRLAPVLVPEHEPQPTREDLGLEDGETGPFIYRVPRRFHAAVFGEDPPPADDDAAPADVATPSAAAPAAPPAPADAQES